MAAYKPGACNIGKNEIIKRYALGAVGIVAAMAIISLYVAFSLPRLVLLVCFIPLFLGFEGIYQGYFKFCAGFAARGIYDLTGSGGKRGAVRNSNAHREDMRKAMSINFYSLITAVLLTFLIYLL
jgi:hypothetical protein